MIRDAKGRKWFMRFKQYREGWSWDARCGNHGQSSLQCFATKVLAEDDARRAIQSCDSIAAGAEYFRRLQLRGGAECQLTDADHEAISRAGRAAARVNIKGETAR